ncbi:tetratricopeptide repeat protein [Methanomethylophilus alvi]|uniref:tetratricopeptide repeat protein n=1 Tax=Methanomethylophilus alvi TaxID=1291540 RepID=UPI0037DC3C63
MYALGIAYANGFGVEYCPEKAFGYFSKAAEQGIVGASLDLGKMYFHGTGVEQSYQKAREWFMTACHDGEAQYYLGEICYRGLGVDRNDALAFEWYYLAMSNGHTEAKVKLAIMFANGHGTEKDSFATSSLLSDAVDEGSRLAIDLENYF